MTPLLNLRRNTISMSRNATVEKGSKVLEIVLELVMYFNLSIQRLPGNVLWYRIIPREC
jgi:hypothetical protein